MFGWKLMTHADVFNGFYEGVRLSDVRVDEADDKRVTSVSLFIEMTEKVSRPRRFVGERADQVRGPGLVEQQSLGAEDCHSVRPFTAGVSHDGRHDNVFEVGKLFRRPQALHNEQAHEEPNEPCYKTYSIVSIYALKKLV